MKILLPTIFLGLAFFLASTPGAQTLPGDVEEQARQTNERRISTNQAASWHATDDTLHWDLAEFKSRPVPDEAAWLAERLSVVGVERSDDLALLEGEDVAPDVAALSGVPDWELQTLRDDFPRTLRYMDGLYACEVYPASRKVLLKPLHANARRVGPPARGQVPRFRGFKVIFSSASREVVMR